MKKNVKEPVWITKHTGKMKGINSISTNCMLNPYCLKRQQNKLFVCAKCYAKHYLEFRPTLRKRMDMNTELLTEHLLDDRQVPIINDVYFRLESFGDLINEMHFINYLRICNLHPQTTFALWTKNLHIIERVFKAFKRPENLVINYSSENLNVPADESTLPSFVDHIFTVYEKKFAKDNDVPINCGKKNVCIKCLKCYRHGGEKHIREELK